MDHQLSFADSEFTSKRRQTRKEKFLGRMEKLVLGPRGSGDRALLPQIGNGLRGFTPFHGRI